MPTSTANAFGTALSSLRDQAASRLAPMGINRFRNLDRYVLPRFRNIQITLSGGGSSAYQAWHILEANGGLCPNWQIVFCNTGFERAETLDFIADFQRNLNVPVSWIERDGALRRKFRTVGHNEVKRAGEPFLELVTEHILRKDGTVGPRPLPSDGPRRLCSGELKTKTAHRYLRSLGWSRYYSAIGFRADEPGRVARRKKLDAKRTNRVIEGGIGMFPMYDAGVTGEDVVAFGAAVPWWLSIPSWKGNCWPFCPMMAEWKLKERIAEDPDSAEPFIAMEEMPRDRNREFRPGAKSVRQLRDEVVAGDMSVSPRALKRRPECGTCHD